MKQLTKGYNLQNIQAVHTAQYQKNKQPNQKMVRRPKQTFLQRRHTDGQQTQEKMCFQHRSLFSSVESSLSVMSDSLQPNGLQHARPPCPSPTPGVDSNSCPLSRWCHSTIASSISLMLGKHQALFQWVSSSYQVAKLSEFQLQHWSFQWIFRTDFL